MKKLLGTIAIIALSFTQQANAQIKQGPYASFNVGYNLASNSGTNVFYGEFLTFYNSTETTSTNTIETVKLSLGKGFNFGGNFGYMFNKNIGTEIGVGYLLGGETTTSRVSTDAFGTDVENNSIKTNQFQIKPALVIAANYEKINPYAKIGLVMGMSKTTYTSSEVDSFSGDTFDMEAELRGGIMLGFRGSAGINYSISDKIALFAEITSISGNVKPTEGEITKSNVNGVSELGDMTYNDTHIEFVDNYTTNGSPEPDNVAQKTIRPSFSAGSLGLNFGMSFHF